MKTPFINREELEAIVAEFPTPFHLYDEKGIREKARAVNQAFSWNKGFKEYFAVKATPTPAILKILQEEGCGVDCSSYVELLMSHKLDFPGSEIMFSSNNTPDKEYAYARELVRPLTWMPLKILNIWSKRQAFQKLSLVVTILEAFLNWGQTSWTILEKPSLA